MSPLRGSAPMMFYISSLPVYLSPYRQDLKSPSCHGLDTYSTNSCFTFFSYWINLASCPGYSFYVVFRVNYKARWCKEIDVLFLKQIEGIIFLCKMWRIVKMFILWLRRVRKIVRSKICTNPRLSVTTPNVLSLSSKFFIIATTYKDLRVTFSQNATIRKNLQLQQEYSYHFDN
jgi:hypothetical protein